MNPFENLEKRTETEAIALLRNDVCPICLHPSECTGGQGDEYGENWYYDCSGCGHEFTILIDDEAGTESLEFGL